MSKDPISNVEVNTKDVITSLQGESLRGGKRAVLTVGYKAEHAVFVHEDTSANHPNGGQAKYLEAPSRDTAIQDSMREAVRKAVRNKKGLKIGLIDAGNILCLLYTSDAADERSSVDLGGRRIIKK